MQIRQRFYVDLVGIIIVLVILTLVIMGTLVWFNTPEQARGSIYNTGPNGVSRFADWLRDEGYTIRVLATETERPGSGDGILFILAPRSGFTNRQLFSLDNWVQSGGTLVIAQENGQPANLPGRFSAGIGRLWLPVRSADLALPLLNWPPVGEAAINTTHYVKSACGEAAIHMGDCQRPLLAAFGRGQGRVFIMATAYPFTNQGIEDFGNAQLIENLTLATAVSGQRIVFDEFHHAIPLSWLWTTPTGWAMWLGAVALIGFFIWHNTFIPTGRAATPTSQKRRLVAETTAPAITLAQAPRQFATNESIKIHYWQRLKRTLARRHGVDPAQADRDFIESLKPHMDEADLGTIVYLAAHKNPFPPMTASELKQWVAIAINLSDSHILTREIYEYQKTA